MLTINIKLLLRAFSVAILLIIAVSYTFTWLAVGVFLLIGDSYRIHVDKVFLDDSEEHNVTLLNMLYLSLLHTGNLTIIAHTSNDTLALSDRYNPFLHFPLIISGLSTIVYVKGEFRLGLRRSIIQRLGIVTDKLEYYTCSPRVLRGSITVLGDSR